MSSRLIAKSSRVTVWVSLLLGLLVPFWVSLNAATHTRDMRCTDEFSWTFAPLLYSCGQPPPVALVAAWIGTFVSVGGLCLAAVASVIALACSRSATPSAQEHWNSRYAAITTALVWIAVLAVISTQPDQSWGTSAWVFLASAAGLIVYVLAAIVRAVINYRSSPTRT